jgi:hypothetical protein
MPGRANEQRALEIQQDGEIRKLKVFENLNYSIHRPQESL